MNSVEMETNEVYFSQCQSQILLSQVYFLKSLPQNENSFKCTMLSHSPRLSKQCSEKQHGFRLYFLHSGANNGTQQKNIVQL